VPARVDFLRALREVTRKHGIVLIFDEVISFRVGYHGAQGLFGVTPDMTTLGKIIGGGFPVGAVAGSADVMAVFDPRAAARRRRRTAGRSTPTGDDGRGAGGDAAADAGGVRTARRARRQGAREPRRLLQAGRCAGPSGRLGSLFACIQWTES